MPVEALPEVAPPVENPPAALQEVASVEVQDKVEDCPLSIVLGLAESVAVGAQACVLQLWLEEPKLVVEVTKYNEQSAAASYSRWVGEFMTPPVPWAHFTSNAYELRARLIRKDGSVIEFAKLAEISEGGRELKHVQENMARRVAYFVFTADALAKAHELGYDK